MGKVDLTPKAHVLHSFMNSRILWHSALAELIDNSYDHGSASSVEIILDGNVVKIRDNGVGVTDVTSCFRYGDHRVASKEGISKYGVGAKDVWLAFCNTMKVITVCDGIKTIASADCEKMASEQSFEMEDPIQSQAPPDEIGTIIELHLRKGKKRPSDDVVAKLSWMFTPAIRTGFQILFTKVTGKVISRRPLKPVDLPLMTDIVQAEFEVHGKGVRIEIGIIADGQEMKNGPFWLIREHRIVECTSLGIKNGYGAKKIAGAIYLKDGWSLSRHKDSLMELGDELGDAIFERIEGVLKKADDIADVFESKALRSDVCDMLNSAIGNAESMNKDRKKQQRRDKGSLVGSVAPKNTGRKQRRTTKPKDLEGDYIDDSGSGSKQSKSSRNRIQFDWQEMDNEGVGYVDPLGKFVWLNSSNKYVNGLIGENRKPELCMLIASMLADHHCRHEGNGQTLLSFSFDNFSESLGSIINEFAGDKNGQE
jgi:hypothetical protein